MYPYQCDVCGRRVAVVDGQIIRGCKHSDGKVVAGLSAVCVSESTLVERVPRKRKEKRQEAP